MYFIAFRNALPVSFLLAGSAFFCAAAHAQRTSEIGAGLGGLVYRGELAPQYQLDNNRPAFTVFYRRDVSVPITVRGAFTAGLLRADDARVTGANGNVTPQSAVRQARLQGQVYEVSAVAEYNFLDYHDRANKYHSTPYLFAGVAGYYTSSSTRTSNDLLRNQLDRDGAMFGFAIPAGVGFKAALTQHLNLGLEVGVRKLFTDQFDHLSQQDPAFVNPNDPDWYFYNGVSLSYTFYKIRCPDQYKKNKRLLK